MMLTKEQQDILEWNDTCCVLATAGSGKTSTIIEKSVN